MATATGPCKYDVNDAKDRKEMATIMASHIEKGAKNYAQFVNAAKKEFTNRLQPGQQLQGNLVDMYKEAYDAYNVRLDSPFMKEVSKIPGVSSIRKASREGGRLFRASADGALKIFAPQKRSEEAETTGYRVREAWANAAREYNIASNELREYRKIIERLPRSDQETFIDNMETGQKQSTPELDSLALIMKSKLDTLYLKAVSFRPDAAEVFNENYFPNWWNVPPTPKEGGIVQERFAGSGNQGRPLEGQRKFLREKVFATNKEGREAGWEWPTDATPIDFVLWKVNELNRFIAAHEIIEDLRSRKWELVVNRAKIPDGWKPLNDKISEVLQLQRDPVTKEIIGAKSGGAVRVYPDAVADLVNNHLDPGIAQNPIYRAYMMGSNLLNSVQLGLSAFHGMFVSLDSTASSLSNAMKAFTDSLQMAKQGDYGKAKAAARESIRSAGLFMTGPLGPLYEGSKLYKEWMTPGSRPEFAPIVDMMVAAGARGKMEGVYKLGRAEKMTKAFRQAMASEDGKEFARLFGKGVANAFPAIVESAAIPIMEYYVPRLKMGIFAQMARTELARLGSGATREQIRKAMGQAWDSVEDRLGEMAYENTHWNKTAKQILQGAFRAIGWQLGNIRAGLGAVGDTASFAKDVVAPGKTSEITHRMVYPIALFTTVALANSMIQALLTNYNTGKSIPPEDVEDLLYPRDGLLDANNRPHRVQTGNYITKDWAPWIYPIIEGRPGAGVEKMIEMAGHKVNPVISLAEQLAHNKTFLGEEIFPSELSGKSFGQRMTEGAGTLFRENVLPFAFRGESGTKAPITSDPLMKALPFFGVIPAPAFTGRSIAENIMMELSGQKYGEAPKTGEEIERQRIRNDLRLRYSRADEKGDEKGLDKIEDEMSAAFDAGKLTRKDLAAIRTGFSKDLTQRLFSQMRPQEAIEIFNRHMSKEEKLAVAQILLKKRSQIFDLPLTEMEKEMLRDRYDDAIEKNAILEEKEEEGEKGGEKEEKEEEK